MRWNTISQGQYVTQRLLNNRRRPLLECLESRALLSATIREFPIPSGDMPGPGGIAVAPDGSLWFSGYDMKTSIGELDPTTDELSEFSVPSGYSVDSSAGGPFVGDDGNVWFLGFNSTSEVLLVIDRITHAVNDFPIPVGSSPDGILSSTPDGKLWFANDAVIGGFDPRTHAFSEFPRSLPLFARQLLDAGEQSTTSVLTSGPGGNLWFTTSIYPGIDSTGHFIGNQDVSIIGEFNATMRTTEEFTVDSGDYSSTGTRLTPGTPLVAPDGNVYFTEGRGGQGQRVDEISSTTHAISQFAYFPNGSSGGMMIVGPDGNLWGAEGPPLDGYDSGIVTFNITTHVLTEALPNFGGGQVLSMIPGPDGNIWFDALDGFGPPPSVYQLWDINPATDAVNRYRVPVRWSIGSTLSVTEAGGNLWLGVGVFNAVEGNSGAIVEAVLNPDVGTTQMQLAATPNPVMAGGTVVLTATVMGSTTGNTPSGTVVFYDGAVDPADELGAGSLAVTGSHDQAIFQTSALTAGAHSIVAVYQGDGNFDGSQSAALVLSVQPSRNQLYVEAVYKDVLGRAPDPNGLVYWTQKLDSGAPHSSVANLIGKSDEYYQNFAIEPDYIKILGRAADGKGLSYWTGKMDAGVTDQQLAADLAASDEFYAKAGGTDAAWVGELYQLLLNRTADTEGEKFWLGQLASGASRNAVAQGVAGSQENNTQLINDDYFHYLGRGADPDGLRFWLQQFANGATNEDVVAGFTGSDEYFKKHTSQPGP